MNVIKIVFVGCAGLVSHNLLALLGGRVYSSIVTLDKYHANIEMLKHFNPKITVEYAELAKLSDWQHFFLSADVVVRPQAQISGKDYQEFLRNNIDTTWLILDPIKVNTVPNLEIPIAKCILIFLQAIPLVSASMILIGLRATEVAIGFQFMERGVSNRTALSLAIEIRLVTLCTGITLGVLSLFALRPKPLPVFVQVQ